MAEEGAEPQLHTRESTLEDDGSRQLAPRLDFSSLTPTMFEELVFDLLGELGFVNRQWHRGTPLPASPADDGRDISAVRQLQDADGHCYDERWLVDVKHYRSAAVPRDALSSLLHAAEAEQADVALFVVSGYLSTSAHRFLREWESTRRPSFRLRVHEHHDLEGLRVDWEALAGRHDIKVQQSRTKSEIELVARRMRDLLWYDSATRTQEAQGDTSDPRSAAELQKQMLEIESRYPEAEFPPWPREARLAVEARLGALNWALGGDWDEVLP